MTAAGVGPEVDPELDPEPHPRLGPQVGPGLGAALDPGQVKSCCAAGYSSDLVRLLLGDSYHPGGLRLTRHLLDRMEVAPGHRLGDVASGAGTSALLAAVEYDCIVHGIDYSSVNVERASRVAAERGLGERVAFTRGDAEQLAVPDASWDRVLCECALCTFPDKAAATREIARVLRPGGRVGITDMTALPERLPMELTSLAAWVACIADARPVEEYADLLTEAGLVVEVMESHRDALVSMIDRIGARIELARMTAPATLAELGVSAGTVRTTGSGVSIADVRVAGSGVSVADARATLDVARAAAAEGVIGYALLIARKPT